MEVEKRKGEGDQRTEREGESKEKEKPRPCISKKNGTKKEDLKKKPLSRNRPPWLSNMFTQVSIQTSHTSIKFNLVRIETSHPSIKFSLVSLGTSFGTSHAWIDTS
jgi:hypothetical protein